MTVLFGIVVCANILYYLFFWLYFPKTSHQSLKASTLPVSIIVVYKNAAEHIKNLIPRLLSQKHQGEVEIILMNDFSTDDHINLKNTHKDSRLVWMHAYRDRPGKKAALAQAIQSASHDAILLTDADCLPNSDDWITQMIVPLQTTETEIVLGYGPGSDASGVVNLFARYEIFITALQYMSYAMAGRPYMGVGRNLAYRKALYEEQRPNFAGDHISSGDDDLAISRMGNASNTRCVIDQRSWCYSDTKGDMKSFIKQKLRHTSTSWAYDRAIQMLLGLFAMSQVLFYLLGTVMLWVSPIVVLVCYIMKQGVLMLNMTRLDGRQFIPYAPLLDFGLAIYYLIMAPLSLVSKSEAW